MRQEANLKKAKLDYERFKPVNEKGFLSERIFLVTKFPYRRLKQAL